MVWHERYEKTRKPRSAVVAPDLGEWLELPTFWTELRTRPSLRAKLWPEPAHPDPRAAFREQEQRAQLLSTAARLGHAFLDLYVMIIGRIESLELRAQETADDENVSPDKNRIEGYLDLLTAQMTEPPPNEAGGPSTSSSSSPPTSSSCST